MVLADILDASKFEILEGEFGFEPDIVQINEVFDLLVAAHDTDIKTEILPGETAHLDLEHLPHRPHLLHKTPHLCAVGLGKHIFDDVLGRDGILPFEIQCHTLLFSIV